MLGLKKAEFGKTHPCLLLFRLRLVTIALAELLQNGLHLLEVHEEPIHLVLHLLLFLLHHSPDVLIVEAPKVHILAQNHLLEILLQDH